MKRWIFCRAQNALISANCMWEEKPFENFQHKAGTETLHGNVSVWDVLWQGSLVQDRIFARKMGLEVLSALQNGACLPEDSLEAETAVFFCPFLGSIPKDTHDTSCCWISQWNSGENWAPLLHYLCAEVKEVNSSLVYLNLIVSLTQGYDVLLMLSFSLWCKVFECFILWKSLKVAENTIQLSARNCSPV